jgi:thiamine-phosphate diphosphorylase
LAEARRALGHDAIAGYSAHGVEEALDAFARGFHCVTLSPVFSTPKAFGSPTPLGLEPLRELCRRARGAPVVALGGIEPGNAPDVMAQGAAGVAMIRGVFDGDPAANVRRLLKAIHS